MTASEAAKARSFLCFCVCALLLSVYTFPIFAEFTYFDTRNTTTAPSAEATTSAELATDVELSRLQDQYEQLEQKIQEGEQAVADVNSGKKAQSESIQTIQSNIQDLNGQIDVLEKRVTILDSDINNLNSSINVLNEEIVRLNTDISDLEERIYHTTEKTELLYSKIKGRLIVNYMAGSASNLEILIGVRDLPTLFTKLEIIRNLSQYDRDISKEFETQLAELQSMNAELGADKSALDTKETALSGEKDTLSARQADMESSQYVLDMKRKLSEHRYTEAVNYMHTLDETSDDYNAMLNLLAKEQDKVDAQINAYLLQYGSSADSPAEGVTQNAGDGTAVSASSPAETTTQKTTTRLAFNGTSARSTTATENEDEFNNSLLDYSFGSTTKVKIVSPESMHLICPLPYKNCYISAPYGQYPSGGPHRGVDICVRGGTEGKNIVAAADGTVISYGFNHWSMGNYIIIDHGSGLFTAYYHMQRLYAAQGDRVEQGQVIGLAGHTGNTTGPHLHFEVRISRGGAIQRYDPMKFISLPK